jgi:ribosomal protein S18 acetylase RimI-like enzyme
MKDHEIRIVRATVADRDLAREAVREVHGRAASDSLSLEEFLSGASHYLLIAVENGHAVGSLTGYALSRPHRVEREFFLQEIDVKPEHRNRGIGKSLVNRFIEEARSARASEV